jgi:hypothetical protein
MTQREVAVEMDWSLSKLIRIETGSVTIATNDLRALLAHYGIVDPDKVARLIDEARRSRARSSWWNRYREVMSAEFASFLGYESSARVIRTFEPLLIPGLLQTEAYARDLFLYIRGAKDPSRTEALVRLRMERQELLIADDAPSTHFIIDEAAIRRVVGGPHTMRRQLQRLREVSKLPNVTLRVVPFAMGLYRGLRVPYVVFEFDDIQDPAILFLEYPNTDAVIQEDVVEEEGDPGFATPAVHLELFWELEETVSAADSLALIDDAMSRLGDQPPGISDRLAAVSAGGLGKSAADAMT